MIHFRPTDSKVLFISSFVSYVKAHQTELNQMLPHTGKWARFANAYSIQKLWSPQKSGPKNAHIGLFWQLCDFTVNTFVSNDDLDNQKMALEITKVPYIIP